MYIYDTGLGFEIIVEDITEQVVKSRTSLNGSRSKLSLLRYNKYGEAYFNREGIKVYLKDLGEEFN